MQRGKVIVTPLKTRTAHGGVGKRVEARDAVGPSQWVVCLGGPPLWEEAPPKSSRALACGCDTERAGGGGRGVGACVRDGCVRACVREAGVGGGGGARQILGVRILFLMYFGIL